MMDRIGEMVLPRIYKFIKRHKRVRDFSLRAWGFLSGITARVRPWFSGRQPMPAPRQAMAAAVWVEKAAASTDLSAMPSFKSVYPAEDMVRTLPGTIDDTVHWKYRRAIQPVEIPGAFLATLPQGRVWEAGYVITPDNVVIEDVSRTHFNLLPLRNDSDHPLFKEHELVPPRHIDGKVAVLAAFGGRGFYHWMYDVLPRLEILRAAGIDPASIDKFYVNECVAPFQFATLDALGIPRDKLLQSHWVHHVEASELLAPSHVGEIAHMPRWACGFFRKTLLPSMRSAGFPGSHPRVYLTRRQSTHRRVTNEDKMIEILRKANFSIVAAEDYSLAQQAVLFSSAQIIMGLHGAGFSNLAFCEPGTKVIEILHPKSVRLLYWTLACQADLNYFYLFAKGEPDPEGVDEYLNEQDITVDLSSLSKILEKAGAG